MAGRMQIVFISAEVSPWSKTGGLGEVMDGLPISLASMGHRVMTISPRWDQYEDAWDTSVEADIEFGEETTKVRYFHAFKDGVDRLFVDSPVFLETVNGVTGQKYYGPNWGSDWSENQVRFTIFSKAALAAIKNVPLGGFPYGEKCVVVANDWHTALAPMYVAHQKTLGMWKSTKVCLLIHNMVYQGRFVAEPWQASVYNLPQSMMESLRVVQPLKVGRQAEAVEAVNWMLGGIRHVDRIMTVSPSYAQEIMDNPVKGVELNEIVMKHGGVVGILNGLKDMICPASEELRTLAELPCTFNMSTLERKHEMKAALQERFNLPKVAGTPVLMFVGRLDFQKGVDVLLEAMEEMLDNHNMQVIVVGDGRADMVQHMKNLENKHPNQFRGEVSFKGNGKYMVYAGSDFTVMPSRFEPCGLVQLEAMRFGVLPIVTPTGGLRDTVVQNVTGIVMKSEIQQEAITDAESVRVVCEGIEEALEIYRNKKVFNNMQVLAMQRAQTFTWHRAAGEYVQEFQRIEAPLISQE